MVTRSALAAPERQRESRSFTDFGSQRQPASHAGRELTADRKPQTGTAVAAVEAILKLDEWFEDHVLMLGCYANTTIGNTDLRFLPPDFGREADGAVIWRELDGVADQVEQQLREFLRIRIHGQFSLPGNV